MAAGSSWTHWWLGGPWAQSSGDISSNTSQHTQQWSLHSPLQCVEGGYYYQFMLSHECRVIVYNGISVECVWLMAGLQPHLAWVRLIRLWLGGAAHLWCMRAIMAPRINQHTHSRRATVVAACNIVSEVNILPSPVTAYFSRHRSVSCVGGPQKSHSCGVWQRKTATMFNYDSYNTCMRVCEWCSVLPREFNSQLIGAGFDPRCPQPNL